MNWGVAVAFALGLAAGGGVAWEIQSGHIASTQAEFDVFVAATKAQGEISENLAKAKDAEYKREKNKSDHDYQTIVARLDADVKRLRDDRARGGYVPAAPASSRNPDVACFDRAELEQALRRFDDEITGFFAEGDANAVGLNVARAWAASIRTLDNPASARP